MRCQPFYFLAILGLAQAKQNLRGRELAVTEIVPFEATMSIKVSDEEKDKVPTTAHYNGVVAGFQNWFHENSMSFYSGNPNYDVTYIKTVCKLNPDETTHTPSSATTHHTISISCQSTFQADSDDGMITSTTLLREATNNYANNDLVTKYLVPASPASSPFKAIRSISLELVATSSTRATQPSTPSNGGSNGAVATTPGNGASNGASTTKGTIPIVLQWTMSVQPNVQDRQPTQSEYTNFMADSEAWLKDIFAANFANPPEGIATFTGFMNSHIKSTSYDEDAQYPHKITIHTDAQFEKKASGEQFPPMQMWVIAVHNTGVNVFRTEYLAKTPGLFQNPQFLQYQALM